MHTDLFPGTLLVTFVDGQPMTDSRKIAEFFGKRHTNVLRVISDIVRRMSAQGGQPNFGPSNELGGRLNFEPSSEGQLRNFALLSESGQREIKVGTERKIALSKLGGRRNFASSSEGRLRNFEQSYYFNEQNKRQPMYLLTRDGFYFVTMGFTGPQADEWKWKFIDAFNTMEAELKRRADRFVTALDAVRPGLRTAVEDAERQVPRAHTAEYLGKSVAAISYRRAVARRLGLLPAANDSARAA